MEDIIDIKYDGAGERLDKFLSDKFFRFSREDIKRAIIAGKITVNKETKKPSYKLSADDQIDGKIGFVKTVSEPTGEKIKLDIIFEDDDVAVINKPAGMVVHPGENNEAGTLVNALIEKYPKISLAVPKRGDDSIKVQRPGIVHRLDKDTTGTIIIAKTKDSYDFLSKKFKERKVTKIYMALCFGWPKEDRGEISNFLARHNSDRKRMSEVDEDRGKAAISKYKVIETYKDNSGDKYSLIEFDIKTGRTHQIRVHAKSLGIPVLGDKKYYTKFSKLASDKLKAKRQFLHAKELTIQIPSDSKSRTFKVKLPKDFQSTIDSLIIVK